ncbi:hypothetical protein C3L33_18088, partial [Rhododendron williamsianum]
MGGRGRSRTQRKHFRHNRENVWKRSKPDSTQQDDGTTTTTTTTRDPGWEPFATQNPAFDDYYKEQGIVSAEEWDVFVEVIRKPLPAAFRINSSSQFSCDIRSQLENDFVKSLQAEAADGSEVEGIRPLPWYPENLAWQSNFSRMQLRKNQTLERHLLLRDMGHCLDLLVSSDSTVICFHVVLIVYLSDGTSTVLGLCAAPGSKTFQLLEMIYQSTEPGSLPSGMNGVAMEPSVNQLLFDRVLCDVPCSGDGTLRKAPDIWRKWSVGMGNGLHGLQVQIAMRGLSLLKVGGRMVYSTCSMNPVENEAVVERGNIVSSFSLCLDVVHARDMHSSILRRCGGSVELLDVSSELPQLVAAQVRDKGTWLSSFKDVPKYRTAGITPSMFPSGKSYVDTPNNDHDPVLEEKHDNDCDGDSANGSEPKKDPESLTDVLDEELSTLPLERCMRIVPHDQNTGAFFIAVFQKLSPLPEDNGRVFLPTAIQKKPSSLHRQRAPEAALLGNELEEVASDTDTNKMSEENELEDIQDPVDKEACSKVGGGKRKLQIQGKWRGVDPVVFFTNDAIVGSIKTFYGIDESFPFTGHLVTRNSDTDRVKRIYYVSKSVKDILELNFNGGQQLKITSVGLKMFLALEFQERQSSKEGSLTQCAFRISSEGLPLLLPFITKQIVEASPIDFKHLLQYKTIKFADFVDAEFGEKASQLMLGCCWWSCVKDKYICDGDAIECQEMLERLSVRVGTGNGSKLLETEQSSVEPGELKANVAETIEDAEIIEVATSRLIPEKSSSMVAQSLVCAIMSVLFIMTEWSTDECTRLLLTLGPVEAENQALLCLDQKL